MHTRLQMSTHVALADVSRLDVGSGPSVDASMHGTRDLYLKNPATTAFCEVGDGERDEEGAPSRVPLLLVPLPDECALGRGGSPS